MIHDRVSFDQPSLKPNKGGIEVQNGESNSYDQKIGDPTLFFPRPHILGRRTQV